MLMVSLWPHGLQDGPGCLMDAYGRLVARVDYVDGCVAHVFADEIRHDEDAARDWLAECFDVGPAVLLAGWTQTEIFEHGRFRPAEKETV
jgi:hypothetical protein